MHLVFLPWHARIFLPGVHSSMNGLFSVIDPTYLLVVLYVHFYLLSTFQHVVSEFSTFFTSCTLHAFLLAQCAWRCVSMSVFLLAQFVCRLISFNVREFLLAHCACVSFYG